MLKKLLVPTLVLTLAGFTGIGCHDSSGNGTNMATQTGGGGTSGGDGSAGADGATDIAASESGETHGDTASTEDGADTHGDTASTDGGADTQGDTASTDGGADATAEAGADLAGN